MTIGNTHYHTPVLLQETVESLQIRKGAKYIDATLGGGGHTEEILKRGGIVLGIDVDEDALHFVKNRIQDAKLICVQGNFRDIDSIAKEHGFEHVAGVLFDFGVSSFQLDRAEKGFSFTKSGPLDMRMDKSLSFTAKDLVNGLTRAELQELFVRLGEERNAKNIASEIVRDREESQIETTDQLVRVIEKAFGVTNEMISPKRRAQMCMRVFQALRIGVNDELGVIRDALPKALELLDKNGRLVVISFHSLEDRIVKQTFVDFEKRGRGKIITKKPVITGEDEARSNRRSRSAKLRVIEKV